MTPGERVVFDWLDSPHGDEWRALMNKIDAAIAEERAACARVAETKEPEEWPGFDTGHLWRTAAGYGIAAAIRARGATEPKATNA